MVDRRTGAGECTRRAHGGVQRYSGEVFGLQFAGVALDFRVAEAMKGETRLETFFPAAFQ